MPQTAEIVFGRKIADELENEIIDRPHLARIPRYSEPEHQIDCSIDGVPFRGFIDSYEPDTHQFLEYKTGRNAWTDKKVLKHLQLPIYSLLIEHEHGHVADKCHLVWIETRFITKTLQMGEHTLEAQTRELELTGMFEMFERVITKEEREETKKLIIKVAEEISEDYTSYPHPMLA